VRAIDVATVFIDFDDYWLRFLGGQAPAPRYAMSLKRRKSRPRFVSASALDCQLPSGSIPLVPAPGQWLVCVNERLGTLFLTSPRKYGSIL